MRIAKVIAVWAGCICAIQILIFSILRMDSLVKLSHHWESTTGTVIGVDRQDHASVRVRYEVAGKPIEQVFSPSYDNAGAAVTVYYSPSEPSLASLRNPASLEKSELKIRLFMGVGLGTFVAIIICFPAAGAALSWPWGRVRMTPRLIVIWITVAIVISTISAIAAQHDGVRFWISHGLVLCGTTLLCVRAFRVASEIPWVAFAKSGTFVIGVALVAVGSAASVLSGQ